MNEEGSGIQKIVAVDIFPLICRRPRRENFYPAAGWWVTPSPEHREWLPRYSPPSRSAEIRIPVSSPARPSALPFCAHCQSDAAIERIGEVANLGLRLRVRSKINARRQYSGEQQEPYRSATAPIATRVCHFEIEEVIIEALIPVASGSCFAGCSKEAQVRACASRPPRAPSSRAPRRRDRTTARIRRRRCWRAHPAGCIRHQTVVRIDLLQKIVERGALESVQQFLVRLRVSFNHACAPETARKWREPQAVVVRYQAQEPALDIGRLAPRFASTMRCVVLPAHQYSNIRRAHLLPFTFGIGGSYRFAG